MASARSAHIAREKGQMIQFSNKFWMVHIYKQGQFSRTINVPFTEVTAEIFCKSFNRAQTIYKAMAKEHTSLVEVEKNLIPTTINRIASS